MKLFKKWKSSKTFRRNVILGIVVFLLLINSSGKKEASWQDYEVCDAFNWFDPLIGDPVRHGMSYNTVEDLQQLAICKANGCFLDYTDKFVYSKVMCVNKVPTDGYTDNVLGCEEGGGFVVGATSYCSALVSPKCYRCTTEELANQIPGAVVGADTVCTSDWMQPLADVVDALFEKNEFSCTTKAYIVMFVGGIVVLAVV